MQKRSYHIIAAASCWGAQIRSCEEGPLILQQSGCLEEWKKGGIDVVGWDTLYPQMSYQEKDIPLKEALPLILDINERLAQSVHQVLTNQQFPLVLGGDHSLAVGTWNGVHRGIKGPMGLIWIDAHMDAHTEETTPSGAWHGMPLAALLGQGRLSHERAILRPEHVVLIGVRSYEEGEYALLKRLGVMIYFIKEVKERGFAAVLREAIHRVSTGTIGYGVSLDVDVIDPEEAPGVGSPEKGGVSVKELVEGVRLLSIDPHLKAFELVEFNPIRDCDGRTAAVCRKILASLLF